MDSRASSAALAPGQTEFMPDGRDLADRIDALLDRAAEGDRSADLAREMEDLLCDGYAACLQIDARILQLERRQTEVMAAGTREATHESREIDARRASLEQSAAEARRSLGVLRQGFVRLGGVRAAHR